MSNRTLLMLISSLFCQFIFAQDEIVNDADESEAEFHVAINPLDSNNIILATMSGPAGVGDLTIYYTHDFGESWEISEFRGNHDSTQPAGDPVIAFDDEGDVYLVNLTLNSNFQIVTIISKSVDGGETWTFGSEIADTTDKPWLAVDNNPISPAYSNIYIPMLSLFGTNLFVLNGDLNTTSEIEIMDNGDGSLPFVSVGKDGDVFVGTVSEDTTVSISMSQFTDGGTNRIHTTEIVSFPDYNASGADISERYQVTVYSAIDNSGGTYDGRLYVAYTAPESENADYLDVYLTTSDDEGITWSTPTPVHSITTLGVQQFYSSLFVNDQGVLLIDWYDRRNHPQTDSNTDFFLGISHDGGDTFTETQLNTESMDFQYAVSSASGFGIGNYHQLVATDNTAVCFWADGRTNDENLNIFMAKVNINNPTVAVEEIGLVTDKISISSPYPNPVNRQVSLEIELREAQKLQYTITDIEGRQLWSRKWMSYNAGKHQWSHICELSSGAYLLHVKSDENFVKTSKFIVLR